MTYLCFGAELLYTKQTGNPLSFSLFLHCWALACTIQFPSMTTVVLKVKVRSIMDV